MVAAYVAVEQVYDLRACGCYERPHTDKTHTLTRAGRHLARDTPLVAEQTGAVKQENRHIDWMRFLSAGAGRGSPHPLPPRDGKEWRDEDISIANGR